MAIRLLGFLLCSNITTIRLLNYLEVGMTTSSKNVLILRALIALCKRDLKLPSDIYDLGYTQIVIDKTVRLDGDKSVMPDLIISSRKENDVV